MNNRGQFQEEIHNNSNILPIVNSLVGGNNMLMFDSQQYIDFPQNWEIYSLIIIQMLSIWFYGAVFVQILLISKKVIIERIRN